MILMTASEASKLTIDSSELENITGAMEWLSDCITKACMEGKSKFEARIATWHLMTDSNGYLVKSKLSRLGYKFEDYYQSVKNIDNLPMDIKMVRISWC